MSRYPWGIAMKQRDYTVRYKQNSRSSLYLRYVLTNKNNLIFLKMKNLFLVSVLSVFSIVGFSQEASKTAKTPNPKKEVKVVETTCGECRLGMKGDNCELAVKIDGKSYFVDGASIHDFGDTHAKEGLCVAVRKAEIQGEVVDGRFKASYFKLLPAQETKKEEIKQ